VVPISGKFEISGSLLLIFAKALFILQTASIVILSVRVAFVGGGFQITGGDSFSAIGSTCQIPKSSGTISCEGFSADIILIGCQWEIVGGSRGVWRNSLPGLQTKPIPILTIGASLIRRSFEAHGGVWVILVCEALEIVH
jgi:hypothetical protein